MGVSVFILIFCLLLGSLALWLGKPRAKSAAQKRRLGWLFMVLALFLGGNAGLAWLGKRSLQAVLDTAPTRSLARWSELQASREVVVVGRSSATATSDDPRYAVYVQLWSGCEYHAPEPLPLAVDGGDIAIVNSDYEQREWGVRSREPGMSEGESVTFLEPESPVVAVGAVSAGGPDAGLTALIVFAGDYDAFVERARGRLTVPVVLFYANALLALVALGLGATLLLSRDDALGGAEA